jgi:recombination protein RecA
MGLPLPDLLALLGSRVESAEALGATEAAENRVLALDWPELDDVLPDGGLPRGVVELAAPRALGGGASIALAAVRAAHARNRKAWCAWVDPEATLYAPGVVAAGVDLTRLLVVRPPRSELARVAVKVAASRGFDVIAIDMDPLPGVAAEPSRTRAPRKRAWPSEVLVRKLALLAAEGGATILLLTDATIPRAVPWPVALRLEISRAPESIALRVAKDRRGRGGLARTVPLRTRPGVLRPTG